MAHGKWTRENFENYHKANPHIYQTFKKFAIRAIERRRLKHFSAKAVFHIIRWYTPVTDDQQDFKIDDGWISHYARKFMDEHPQYDGYFKTVVRRGSYHEKAPPPPEITEQSRFLM
jgi:hypothetical protein